jgi:tetratricopeptide (TPR) repeat protein
MCGVAKLQRMLLIAIATATLLSAVDAHAHEGQCTKSAASISAGKILEESPRKLDARIALADALIAASCFDEAVHVLEDGEKLHGRNTELQAHLREARSMLNEQHYFDGLGRAEEAAKLSRNVLRCNKLNDIAACDAALAQKPDDADIMVAKGDALLQAQRLADALSVYRRAKELASSDAVIDKKIAEVETQRSTLAATCQSSVGQTALQACEAAFMPGGDDAFDILKRKGVLLQALNQPAAALDAYIAAAMFKHDDTASALAIVSLSESTGRRDAVTLAARGWSLLALGRPGEAAVDLRQALTLSPALRDVKAQLARAERLARNATPRPATAAVEIAEAPPAARRYSNAAPVTRSN